MTQPKREWCIWRCDGTLVITEGPPPTSEPPAFEKYATVSFCEHVVPAADLLAAQAEREFMRNELEQLWQFVYDSGLDASKLVFKRSTLAQERDEALELLAEWNALGETLLAKRHAKSGGGE